MTITIKKKECITKEIVLEIKHNDCYKYNNNYYRFVIENNQVFVHKIDFTSFIDNFQFAICESIAEDFEKIVTTYEKISLEEYDNYFKIKVLCHKPLITGTSNLPD